MRRGQSSDRMAFRSGFNVQNNIAAVSADDSTVWVLICLLNSSCRRSIAFDVRIDFHWLFGNRANANSSSPASSRLSTTARHFNRHLRMNALRFEAYLLVKGNPRHPAKPLADVQPWEYSGNRAHPTEKAVGILTPVVQAFSKLGDIVLDPFAGSGSTAVAGCAGWCAGGAKAPSLARKCSY